MFFGANKPYPPGFLVFSWHKPERSLGDSRMCDIIKHEKCLFLRVMLWICSSLPDLHQNSYGTTLLYDPRNKVNWVTRVVFFLFYSIDSQ